MRTLIVDWSLLSYKQWFRMKSPNYTPKSELEIEEFAINMASEAYKYRVRFRPDKFIFALDARPPWRDTTYNQFYDVSVKYWKSLEEQQHWVVGFDSKYFRCKFHDGPKVWQFEKFNATDKKNWPTESQDQTKWMFFDRGNTPPEVLEAFPESPKTVKETDDWEGLKKIVPTYKGNRQGQKWDFNTSKEDLKKHMRALAFNLAPVVGAMPVEAELTEADDVAAYYAQNNPGEEIILVSADQDWHQLLISNPHVSIWDPYFKHWVTGEKEQISLKLLCKLLGGDTSDNIAGVSISGRNPLSPVQWDESGKTVKGGKNTYKQAMKLMDKFNNDFGLIHKVLMEESEDKSYLRNLMLISFNMLPDHVKWYINHALQGAKVDPVQYQLTDFGVDITMQREIEMRCKHMMGLDEQGRSFENGQVAFVESVQEFDYKDV